MGHRIAAITKTQATNIGNQAISVEFVELVKSTYADAELYIWGRPRGLRAYGRDRLESSREDPYRIVDGWAKRIVGKLDDAPRGPVRPGVAAEEPIELHKRGSMTQRTEPARRVVRRVLRLVGRLRAYNPAYATRLATLRDVDVVLYNGAGEVSDRTNVALRQMVELRVAQLLGCRVVPTNQSIMLRSTAMQRVVAGVYGECEEVIVRGPDSRRRLIEYGVSEHKVRYTPDIAFLCRRPPQDVIERVASAERIRPGTIGLCLSRGRTHTIEQWLPIIELWRRTGKDVVFISNQLRADLPGAQDLAARCDVRIIDRDYDYVEYQALLAGMDMVVSSRLHTCILAYAAGTPVMHVDIGTNKKLVDAFGVVEEYPIQPVQLDQQGWERVAIAGTEKILQDADAVREFIEQSLPGLRERAKENVRWDFAQRVVA